MIVLGAFADEAASSLEGQIEALLRNRIYNLELRTVGGRNVKDFSAEEARGYAAALARAGISVPSVGSPIGKSDIGEDFSVCLREARRVFSVAQCFGARRVRIFSFYHAENARGEVLYRLRTLVKEAKKYSLELCHENEKGIYGDTAERVADLLDNVEGLGCVYDPANFIQVGETADKTLPLLHRRAACFHIKDVVEKTGEIVPAGEGDGQIARLISMTRGNAVLTLEPHLSLFEGYQMLDKTELGHVYRDGGEAFDAAANALKALLRQQGYREGPGGIFQ